MINVDLASLKNITKVSAKELVENLSVTFEDYEILAIAANIAGLPLLGFYEVHQRETLHRYETVDFEDAQAAGAAPRLISHLITKEYNMKISVKDSAFGIAARQLNDATPAEWDAATKAHKKPVGKSKSEADMRELALSTKWAETFEDPVVQKEFDDWARGVSMGDKDMTWMYAKSLTPECPYGSDGSDPLMEADKDMTWMYAKSLTPECPYGSDGSDPLMEDFNVEAEFDNNPEKDVDHYVSGKHYNDVVPGMQYMQMMQHMLDGKSGVEAHLFGQVYKYLMRAGKKDDYEQDIRKARWYTNCLVKFVQTGEIHVDNND